MTQTKRKLPLYLHGRRIQKMITHACLVAERNDFLLLIRLRAHTLWSLPGGKVKKNELPEQALRRVLEKELGIHVPMASLTHVTTIIDPNHDGHNPAMLICFAGNVPDVFYPSAAIAEVAWIKKEPSNLMTPAVQILIEQRNG